MLLRRCGASSRGASAVDAMRIVLVGTGTGVGKTHVACCLVRALSQRAIDVVGLKPIETGIEPGASSPSSNSDQARLFRAALGLRAEGRSHRTASGSRRAPRGQMRPVAGKVFHVKQTERRGPVDSLFAFEPPVSPHIAAREARTRLDLAAIDAWVALHEAPTTVIESAGALFSPLGHGLTNLELTTSLRPDIVLLVASDRLGILHELTATLGLAAFRRAPPMAVVLSAPEFPDASTGRNAEELGRLGIARPIVTFPRASERDPLSLRAAASVLDWVGSQ